MSSAVYFKFKASIKQYTIPFEGSAISVKDLRNAIRLSCGLKSTDFELQILDKQGKEFAKEEDLIPKFSDLIVRRLPKANDLPRKKIANPEDMTRRDPYKAINSLPKINPYSNSINLAISNIPDDDKLDIMAKRCSEEYSEKNFVVKSKPYGIPPASYVCNKCHQGGHWIHECPGLRDKDGRLLDFKSVKRPTGIPQDFLLEVSPGTPGAYLTKEGKYMVPIKDAEAYAMGKKEKRPFSIDENPPYVPKNQDCPTKIKCSLCCKLLENPTCTPCCSSVYCEKCITDFLYDPDVNGSRKCPNCSSLIEHHTSLIEHESLRQLIQCWKSNMLTKEIVDCCVTTLNHSSKIKTELNEDSSKSPDMKFESANPDTESISAKIESEKVFVNNRRVLKPKTSNLMRNDSPSNIKPSTPDKLGNLDNKIELINNLSAIKNENVAVDIKNEKTVGNFNDVDVNDLIFDKVQDFDSAAMKDNSSDKQGLLDKPHDIKAKADQNLRIEIISKRVDNGIKNLNERKIESNKVNTSHCARMDGINGGHMNSHDELSNIHQTFSTIMNPGVDVQSQLLNHFPTTTQLVTSVQQQFLTNPIPLNAIEPLQWPIMYNNMSLQSMFGPPMNPTTNSSNWINNTINIPPPHPVNQSRILTKEEFYERQRRLRAEKLKLRYKDGSSRSPSGSQSPKRKYKSRSKYHDYKDKYDKYNLSRHYHVPSKRVRARDSKDKYVERESRSNHRRPDYPSPKERTYKPEVANQDIKTIDPKLMEDSINTFLKYLTVNPEDKRDSVVISDNNKHDDRYRNNNNLKLNNSSSKFKSEEELVGKTRPSRRSTRSRSVPKISKDRLVDNQRSSKHQSNRESPETKRDVILRNAEKYSNINLNTSEVDKSSFENDLSRNNTTKEKKSKKSKHKDHSDDEDTKRKRKHKKHKHKKLKKVKKEKKDY